MPQLRGLYAISDSRLSPGEAVVQHVEQALLGGCRIIQYREKSLPYEAKLAHAEHLKALCDEHQAMLFINDDVKLAMRLGCHVHLGQEDMPLARARDILGGDAIIGATCHNSLELAEKAVLDSADYLAFGAFFPSPTKPNAIQAELATLSRAKQLFDLPIVAIGGITLDNCTQVIENGADMIAVISALFAPSDIQQQSERFQQHFKDIL